MDMDDFRIVLISYTTAKKLEKDAMYTTYSHDNFGYLIQLLEVKGYDYNTVRKMNERKIYPIVNFYQTRENGRFMMQVLK